MASFGTMIAFKQPISRGSGDVVGDALFAERKAHLEIAERITIPRPVEHFDAERDVVRRELPASEHVKQMRSQLELIEPASVNWPIST